MKRKRKGGRYTPPKEAGDEPPRAMRFQSGRVGPTDPAGRLAEQEKFLAGTIFPESLVVLRPAGGPTLPPMLVVLVDSDDIDAGMRRVLEARAGEPSGVEWGSSARGQVGWTTLASLSGDPVADANASFAKLNLDLTEPMRYKASFAFHLAQSRFAVEAVASGGLFAFAVPELVRELATMTFADAMDSLPYFVMPAAPNLVMLLRRLSGDN